MAFSPPSLQREYSLCSSLDPALDLPVIPDLAPDAPASEVERVKRIVDEYTTKLRNAQETGRWHEITKKGEDPTIFTFEQIHGTTWTWFKNECLRLGLQDEARLEFLFRVAIRRIAPFGNRKLEFDTIDGFQVAKRSSLEPLYDLGRDSKPPEPELGRMIVMELGGLVAMRSRGLLPLS